MNKLKTVGISSLLLGLVTFGPTAFAQDAGWYAGVTFGQSKTKGFCSDVRALVGAGSCDDSDTGWKIFGGYQINKFFGVELGYVTLGEAKFTRTGAGVPTTASIEPTGFQLAAVGTWPITDRFAAFGKVGFFSGDPDLKCSGALLCASESGTELAFGAGVKWDFTRNVAVRGEWERFNLDDFDVDLLSVSVVYKF